MRLTIQISRRQLCWLLLGALLAVTVWFPSTREAQILCLRWLFDLRGNTFVQGQPPGCIIYEIPNVRFTPKYEQELRNRSTNSLDDFALATTTYGTRDLFRFPRVESAWRTSPLLPWATFQIVERVVFDTGTNPLSLASSDSPMPLVRLAQKSDRSNGAFFQAEAALDFAAQNNTAAIRALWTAASMTNWDAGSAEAFTYLSRRFEQAGLSELDAAIQAEEEFSFTANTLQGQNQAFIRNQMVQAVAQSKPEEFSKLLQLLVELRRVDWSDHFAYIDNAYRRFSPSYELIDAMAVPLKVNLATNWTSDYEHSESICQSVFHGYLIRYSDPATMVRFETQTDSYQSEHQLRKRMMQNDDVVFGWFPQCQATGVLSMLMLSLLCAAVMFEIVIWYLKNRAGPPGQWPRGVKFWTLSCLVIICSSSLLTRFAHAIGIDFDVGFGPVEPTPLMSPLIVAFFFALFVFSCFFAGLVSEWRDGKLLFKPWQISGFVLGAWLVAVMPMAYYRCQLVAVIGSQYQ